MSTNPNWSSSALMRVAFAALGLLVAAYGLFTYAAITGTGFPDGHITEYQQAMANVFRFSLATLSLLLLGILGMGWSKPSPKTLLCLAAGFLAVVVLADIVAPWFYGSFIGLDNGVGA